MSAGLVDRSGGGDAPRVDGFEGGGGEGLGVAGAHGGGITVDSREGEGSRFVVSLPSAPLTGRDPLLGSTGARLDFESLPGILVLEKPEWGRESASHLLAELGARALAHHHASRALEFAAAVAPDVILIDDALPDGCGWEVRAALAGDRRTASIPVVMLLSRPGDPGDDRPAIARPLSARRLRRAIGRFLPPEPANSEAPTRAAADGEGPLILLAEDNELNIRTVERFIVAQGYRLAIARSGPEALARVERERPAAIVMDIQMPGIDGLEVTRRLRADPRTRQLPIVALTALTMPGDRERCLAAGADIYMSKPVSLKDLSESIGRLLRQGRMPPT